MTARKWIAAGCRRVYSKEEADGHCWKELCMFLRF